MFAVIETGGKQYRVKKDDVITVEKLKASGGEKVQFNSVLLTGGEKTQIGNPHVKGAGVQALVLEQLKSKKVVSFVKRRRKSSSKTKKGHRQQLTLIKITEILNTGAEKTNITEAVSGKGLEINYSQSVNKKTISNVKNAEKSADKKVTEKNKTSTKKKEVKKKAVSTEKKEVKIDEKSTKKTVAKKTAKN